MRSAFNKEIARSITRSAGRFIAIAVISLLGAGFYAGLRMAAPDMRIAADEFFDATGAYDFSVVCEFGLDESSLELLRGTEGVGGVMGAYRADAMVRAGDGSYAAEIESLPPAARQSDTSDGVRALSPDEDYLNRPILEQGAWPRDARECAVGADAAEKLGIRVGDAVLVEKTADGFEDALAETSFTVAGLVNSPTYISSGMMGTTQLGSGEIELYLYVPEDAFDADSPYALAYLAVPAARPAIWDTESYDRAIDEARARVEQAARAVADQRRAAVVEDAQRELDEARADYESERADAESELDDAADELAAARSRLDSAAAELVEGRAQVDDAAAQIAASERELQDGEDEYAQGAKELAAQRKKLQKQAAKLEDLEGKREQLVAGIARAEDGVGVLEERREQAAAAGDETLLAGVDEQLAAVRSQVKQLDAQLAELDEGIAAIREGLSKLDAAQDELDAARAKLDRGWAKLERGRKKYLDGLKEYQNGLAEYLEGEASYNSGMADYESGRAEADGKFADAESDLAQAQRDIDAIGQPAVHVLDRSKNPGAASLAADADGIAQIAAFLPFMFFLVAALVVLTSMTRMVDEERLEIGTHKALGYRPGRITQKYLVYGALASGSGALAGVVSLGKLLPWFILTSYAVSYNVPVFPTPLDPLVVAKALGLSLGTALLSTWGAAAASLRERPAALMLPRVPKAGKRIFLERIRPLWARMSFSHKVTARNLLRYKRRFLMAVVGVAGCTALLMVGFGLRDAIGSIVQDQYGELVLYDMAVRVEEGATADERAAVRELLRADAVEGVLEADAFTMIAQGPHDDLRVEVVVPSRADELPGFVALRERQSGAPIALGERTVVLTEKAAGELGAHVGDTVVLFDEDEVGDKAGEGRAFTLGAIAENYLGHYAYLAPAAYEEAFGAAPSYDLAYVRLARGADAADAGSGAARALADELLATAGVSTASRVSDKVAAYEEMLAVMDKLIVVIVLLSAALAFVVLYNLTNINITERIREIATLKVLGFTRGEVGAYIFREVFVMTLIGALAGCVLGVPLTFYIARAAETANMMFGRSIEPASFALSFFITVAFAGLVAFAMRGKLSKVNMVESLKSVE